MAVRRAASRALTASERAQNRGATSKSRARTARRRIEAEKAIASKRRSAGGRG